MSKQTIALAAAAAAIAAAPQAETVPPQASAAMAPVPYDLVIIELDRPRRLLLSWGAMRRIKESTGYDFRQPGAGAPWDTEMVPTVLCEMLRHEDPEITVEQVENLVHIGNLAHVIDAIFACMGVDTGTAAPAEEGGAEGETPFPPEPLATA